MLQKVIEAGSAVSSGLWGLVCDIAEDEEADWIARAAALGLIGHGGELDRSLYLRMWSRMPISLRPDLADATCVCAARFADETWAHAFVGTLDSDPVLQVVVVAARENYQAKMS
ncbi:hypothetical protein [Amycolatopsis cihanbeyliensis]|uniref:hypothetical protein n=1 Tax=Amycolatopsis cihanbeyliensis TaxID=1128664 RepID=UPI0011509797|nr:hypothetical protein [Amycolatopsis cihanbeyliensis]